MKVTIPVRKEMRSPTAKVVAHPIKLTYAYDKRYKPNTSSLNWII